MKKILLLIVFLLIFTGSRAQEKYTDQRDGSIYRTIKVEGTIWMAENLRYPIESAGVNSFDKNPHNVASLGVLYDWKSASVACPDGWHLPSGEDFRKLINHYETDDQWITKTSGPNAFGIQLAGMQDYEGTFSEMGESAYYWTSTEYSETEAEFFSYLILKDKAVIDISRKTDMPDIHGAEKSNKYSVRCIKN